MLAVRNDCTGRVGVIGFCMGDGYALALAPTGAYDAASVNYGVANDRILTQLSDACPIVASYGGRDRSLRDAAARLERLLTEHGIDHDVKEYPDAGHGFFNNHAPGETPLWAAIAGRYAATAYHAPSARRCAATHLGVLRPAPLRPSIARRPKLTAAVDRNPP